jgi:arginine exporter protein ArgO
MRNIKKLWEVSFMYKAGRVVTMVTGVLLMCAVSVVFGFTETEIPNLVYLAMWVGCAGMIYYGSEE